MKERILTSLIAAFVITSLQAQTTPAVPRLVVGLTIDQLRSDYIEAFSALYGERGFKRLMREGRVYCNAEYDFINIDRSSAVASIYTGTTPCYNGVVGNRWMDRASLRIIKVWMILLIWEYILLKALHLSICWFQLYQMS